MGCFGCNLYRSTLVAALVGIIFSVFGVTWTTFFYSIFVGSEFATEMFVGVHNHMIVINDTDIILVGQITTGVSLGLHAMWLFLSIILLLANYNNLLLFLRMWIAVTVMIIITDLPAALYFVRKAGEVWKWNESGTDMFAICLTLVVLFSKFGTIIHCVLVFQIAFVGMRCSEMEKERKHQKFLSTRCFILDKQNMNLVSHQLEASEGVHENDAYADSEKENSLAEVSSGSTASEQKSRERRYK